MTASSVSGQLGRSVLALGVGFSVCALATSFVSFPRYDGNPVSIL